MTGRPWSLGNPHPDHHLSVMRTRLGRNSWGRGAYRYGTVVRCSCGNPSGWHRVSHDPPSRSRVAVNAHYQAHVEQAIAAAERDPEPVYGEPPCLS